MTKRPKKSTNRKHVQPAPSAPGGPAAGLKIWGILGVAMVLVVLLVLARARTWNPPAKSARATNAPAVAAEPGSAAPKVTAPEPAPAPAVPDVKPKDPAELAAQGPSIENIDTNSLSDMLNYGNYLLQQNETKGAEAAYRRAVEINPDDEDAHFNLAISLARQRRFAEAITEYEATLEIYPDYLEAKNNLANSLIMVGRTNDAIAQLEEALELNPDYTQALNNLGRLHAVQRDPDKAIELFERARDLDPEDFEIQFNLGNVNIQKGNPAAAAKAFEAALALQPENLLAVNLLAQALTLGGQAEKALTLLQDHLQRHPDSPELLYNSGLLLLRTGRPTEAVTALQRVVKLEPTFGPAQEALKEAETAAARVVSPPDLKSSQ